MSIRKIAAIFFALIIPSLILSGCDSPEQVTVANQCVGSWLRIIDGDGHVVISRIEFGAVGHIDMDRMYSGSVLLVANAFSLEDNRPLGATSRNFSVYKGGGYPVGPEYDDWIITSLTTTSRNGGCVDRSNTGSGGGPVYGNPAWQRISPASL